jgi:hypothetical protein
MQIELPSHLFTFPEVPLPTVWSVRQIERTPALPPKQIEQRTREALESLLASRSLPTHASVAVGVGSRGIANLALIVRTVVGVLKAHGHCPFIVPAMGSHGGATAQGQAEVLHSYGITPENVGAEIKATMEVSPIGELTEEAEGYKGFPVVCDRNALQADAILLINRIKPHTDFTGPIESGIAKMLAIGLGKQQGAERIHHYGAAGLRDLMPHVARFMAAHLPVLGGIALIENSLGHTGEIHPVPPHAIGRAPEQALLDKSRKLMPHLPFSSLDLLLVDEMGKNISGSCMDTHVIGRAVMPSIPESEWDGPNIRLIAVFDLTDASHGNAAAFGLADMITERLAKKIDFVASYINMRTSGEGGIQRARLPLILPTPEDCVRTGIATCGRGDWTKVRLARIRNTADLQNLEISQALLEEAKANPDLEVAAVGHPLDLSRPLPAGR